MTVLEDTFPTVYEILDHSISRFIDDNSVILDLGCKEGAIADAIDRHHKGMTLYGIDIDGGSLERMMKKEYNNVKTRGFKYDIKEILSRSNPMIYSEDPEIDTITMNAAFHEMTGDDKRSDVINLFRFFENSLREGRIIFGDYYYSHDIPKEEIAEYMQHLNRTIGHATPPERFVAAELFDQISLKFGYTTIWRHEIQSIPDIDLRYYHRVLEKI
ncbi:hypothetical protein H6503_03580 [Candidatus Woesearchaeota archaeon]|nr:hypothetical protein [Candidatus Woesearchaeota archaeon]